jgi:hypothetical protein
MHKHHRTRTMDEELRNLLVELATDRLVLYKICRAKGIDLEEGGLHDRLRAAVPGLYALPEWITR